MNRYNSVESNARMASYNPGKLYGWKRGAIEPGYDAELILIDENFCIKQAWQKACFQ